MLIVRTHSRRPTLHTLTHAASCNPATSGEFVQDALQAVVGGSGTDH